jgi:hypothetical protein
MSDTDERLPVDEAVQILEQSEAHRDLIRYLKRADDQGGTALASSLRRSLNFVTVEKWATRGTAIEEALYRDGAQGALSCGNLDKTNTDICEQIVEDYHQ